MEKGGYIPLIVAGGGGGQGYRSTSHQKSHRIVDTHNATGISGYTSPYGSGKLLLSSHLAKDQVSKSLL